MPPAVSVAMGVYDGARFVREQVRSIVEQSVPVAELVVADDGSTDGTLDAIRAELAAADGPVPDLVVLPAGAAPHGVTGNFERALLASTGDVIALSDQDDRWHPDRVAVGLDALADERVSLTNADADLVDEHGAPMGLTLFDSIGLRDAEIELVGSGRGVEALIRRNIVTGATTMLRRPLLALAAPFPRSWVHDEWLAMIAAATARIATVRRVVVDYRQHGGNQIGTAVPTLGYKVGRMLAPRGDRLAVLAERSTVLVERLEAIGVPEPVLALAREKAAFETVRGGYPDLRIARLPGVLGQWRRGRYGRLSSQGALDVVRDLVQPAGAPR